MRQALAALTLAFLASCASIINSNGFKSVEVSSNPPGSRFTSDAAGVTGITPAVVDMPNGRAVTFHFTLDGHEPQDLAVRPRMSGWILGNILFGGIIGLVVDAVSDGSRVHGDVSVNLLPLAPEVVGEEPADVPEAAVPSLGTGIE
jgi:hypothetical protein